MAWAYYTGIDTAVLITYMGVFDDLHGVASGYVRLGTAPTAQRSSYRSGGMLQPGSAITADRREGRLRAVGNRTYGRRIVVA